MGKKSAALAGIFGDDEPAAAEAAAPATPEPGLPEPATSAAPAAAPRRASTPARAVTAAASRGGGEGRAARNHGSKKPVLIHIPEDMHRLLRRISVEEGEPLTAITERMLRQYLVAKGHTKFASPASTT